MSGPLPDFIGLFGSPWDFRRASETFFSILLRAGSRILSDAAVCCVHPPARFAGAARAVLVGLRGDVRTAHNFRRQTLSVVKC